MYYKYKDYLLVIPSVEIGYSTYSIHMNSDLKQQIIPEERTIVFAETQRDSGQRVQQKTEILHFIW